MDAENGQAMTGADEAIARQRITENAQGMDALDEYGIPRFEHREDQPAREMPIAERIHLLGTKGGVIRTPRDAVGKLAPTVDGEIIESRCGRCGEVTNTLPCPHCSAGAGRIA